MARCFKIALAAVLALGQASMLLGTTAEAGLERSEQPPLRWRTKVVTVAFSSSLTRPASNIKAGSDVIGAVRRSLRTWEEAAGIEFKETFSEKLNVSPHGNGGDGVSLITVAPTAENALLFSKSSEEVAATTRLYFDGRGRITEADIVLNPYQQFSTDGTFGTFDLESAFTHEIGHLLGLEHSAVRSSTMHENFGKNGVFGLQNFLLRTLSEVDRAAVRAKYPVAPPENCCGTISAKLLYPEGRPAPGVAVWVEETSSGRVMSEGVSGADGTVEFGGVPFGTYTLFSARKERGKTRALPLQVIGTATVDDAAPVPITKKLEAGLDDIELKYTGFNGQLSVSSVPINGGKSYTVFIGGRNLNARTTSIRFSSQFLEVTPGTIVSHDYGDDISVLSFEVTAQSRIPVGDYTVFVESASGGRSAAVGGISIRPSNNPVSIYTF